MPINFDVEKWMDRNSYIEHLAEKDREILCMNNQRQEMAHWYMYQNALAINRSRLNKISSITDRFGEWDNDNEVVIVTGKQIGRAHV